MRVYIAGPYTIPDPVVNTRNAFEAAERLSEAGHIPLVPHNTLLWHLVFPKPAEWWYDYDLKWLDVCDVLVRLPGESYGADREVEYARAKGIPVYYGVEEFLAVAALTRQGA